MDFVHYKTLIKDRIAELQAGLQRIENDLEQPLSADLNDQAIDLEDTEVLEGLGHAQQQEVHLLNEALRLIADGSYGTCHKCYEPISNARLDAVLYAQICKKCAVPARHT